MNLLILHYYVLGCEYKCSADACRNVCESWAQCWLTSWLFRAASRASRCVQIIHHAYKYIWTKPTSPIPAPVCSVCAYLSTLVCTLCIQASSTTNLYSTSGTNPRHCAGTWHCCNVTLCLASISLIHSETTSKRPLRLKITSWAWQDLCNTGAGLAEMIMSRDA